MSGSKTSGPTGDPQDRRKLVAVVYADMVGYSRLIGLDDAGTLQRLRTLRREVIDPAIEEHGGRIVQTGGDSLLIVFDSIDGAVRCAVQIQEQVPIHEGDQPHERAIRFRMGINIGDAIPDGTDLHGDAVNVAARLQTECPPGGICISRSVRDHVHGRLGLEFEELGPLNLKNIANIPSFNMYSTTPTAQVDDGVQGTPYTVGQLDAAMGSNMFDVAIDVNTASGGETLELFQVIVNGAVAFDFVGPHLIGDVSDNGNGFADWTLSTVDLSSFKPTDTVLFHAFWDNADDGGESFFLVSADPVPAPEPAAAAILGIGVLGMLAVRNRCRPGSSLPA